VTPSPLLRISGLATLLTFGLFLSGCISLFPTQKPVQLYRFDESPPAPTSPAPPALAIGKGPTAFPSDAGGDRLLAVTGQEAAFIADARWIEPASLMFEEAVEAAFDEPGSPRLGVRGESLGAPASLRLQVRRFEADYDQGPAAAPTVAVIVNAVLIRTADRKLAGEKLFEVRVPARENRVGAIVAAYNQAVAQATGQIRDWTTVTAAGIQP
jgi:cholesterol transport system auxiliary component